MSKRAQLEAYINHSHFGWRGGRPVAGLAAAARTYYQREPVALDDRQFLSLVAMLRAPRDLDPSRKPAANAERVRRIEAMLAGRCAPQSVSDDGYRACAGNKGYSCAPTTGAPIDQRWPKGSSTWP